MPEVPEVDSICRVVRRHATGGTIRKIEVLRGKYFSGPDEQPVVPPEGLLVVDVYRVGKYVLIKLAGGGYIQTHNAMTGFFDWDVEEWCFDYVEGKRKSHSSDVRVKLTFEQPAPQGPPVTKVLRFHDARLFGRMDFAWEHPSVGPELLETPMGFPRPIMTLEDFATVLYSQSRPIKDVLMDQSLMAGIGNIYSSEALHLSGIDPRIISNTVNPDLVPCLLEAVRVCFSFCIPKITYGWLKVYRRNNCDSCGNKVTRCEIKGRATFLCERCQLP